MSAEPSGSRLRVGSAAEAAALASDLLLALRALEGALAEESGHIAAGRVRQGLAMEGRKAELAGTYLRLSEAAKANAVALARFAPGEVGRLREAHAGFRAVAERNTAVLATARSVSEGLVRAVAEAGTARARPQVYGGLGASGRAAPAGPLVLSARL